MIDLDLDEVGADDEDEERGEEERIPVPSGIDHRRSDRRGEDDQRTCIDDSAASGHGPSIGRCAQKLSAGGSHRRNRPQSIELPNADTHEGPSSVEQNDR